MKVCSPHLGHMTKMAAMPIYGKNPLKSSSPEPKGQWPCGLVCSIGDIGPMKFEKNDSLESAEGRDLDLFYGKVKFF